ncbi:MAG: small basic protein [Phycisphaerales bacterium]|jgi:small basic protein (TIGR04137 family)|nr:small basic protein [Phycisphaerales bacterium]
MTIDASLKVKSGLTGRRSVLTRAERIEKMIDAGTFNPEADDASAFGLPKMRTIRPKAGGKKKKAEKTDEATEE